jgi:hypothetical protein
MTPPTSATVRSTNRSPATSRRASVRPPRRISGAGPVGSAATAAAVAIPAPGIALPRRRPVRPSVQPRRGPARRTTRRTRQGAPGIALRTVAAFEGISSSSLLDRLIRGRAWIGLLAFALIGIVTMQLLVLELNRGIGHTLGRMAVLQRENAQLSIEDSTYSAESRVAPLAAAAGMTLAPPGAVHFVTASPTDVAHASRALSTAIQPPAGNQLESTEAHGGEAEPSAGTTTRSAASTGETSGTSESTSARESSISNERTGSTSASAGGETSSSNTSAPFPAPGG